MGLFSSPTAFSEVAKAFVYKLYGLASEVVVLAVWAPRGGEGGARSEGPSKRVRPSGCSHFKQCRAIVLSFSCNFL